MVKSMTGYGRTIICQNSRKYQIEIKSVNHRYFDVSIKMPRVISFLEEDVRNEISKYLSRGKIDVFISFDNSSIEGRKVIINKELAREYIKELKTLSEIDGISSNIEVIDIAKYPDVLTIENNQEDDIIKQELLEATREAVKELIQMREFEGEKIAQDLQQRVLEINKKIDEISNLSSGLIEDYVVKLEGRIKEILKDQEIDKARLAQEVVIYADKCSIEEEVTRLKSHVHQFKKILETDGAVGKKLDFIVQEMNRETNTIGSKANMLEITNNVIDIKCQIENIREQIQNIE